MHQPRLIRYRPLMFAGIVLLLASNVALLPARSTAQPLCLDGTIWDAAEQACVDMESPTPTATDEAPAPTPTTALEPTASGDEAGIEGSDGAAPPDVDGIGVEPTQDPGALERSGEYPMGLTMYSHLCPAGFDIANASPEQRVSACQGWLGGVVYSLGIDGEDFSIATSPEGAGGAGWYVEPGLANVRIFPPDYHRYPPVVTCATSRLVEPANSQAFSDTTGTTGIHSFNLQLQQHAGQDDIWYCSAYFRPEAQGSVVIDVRQCPDTLDIYAVSSADLAAACTTLVPGVEFMLLHSSEGISTTVTSSASRALFSRLEPGTGWVTLSPPPGTGLPTVYCETLSLQGQTYRGYDWMNVGLDASWEVEIGNDRSTLCDVYIVNDGIPVQTGSTPGQAGGPPVASPAASPPAPEPDGDGLPGGTGADDVAIDEDELAGVAPPDDAPAQVTLVSFTCDPARDYTQATAADLTVWCQPAKEPVVEFSLTDGSGEQAILHTAPNDPVVTFETVVPGVVTIDAALPGEHAAPQVYCQTIAAGTSKPATYDLQEASGTTGIVTAIVPGSWTVCDWFHIPEA